MKFFKPIAIAFAVAAITALSGCGDDKEQAELTTTATEVTTAVTEGLPTESANVDKNAVGNSTSNYNNCGMATMYKDNIYYVGKDNGKRGIYRIINSTGTIEMMTENVGQDLSTVDDIVYYIDNGDIYKAGMRTAPELIKEDGTISEMCANSDWLYYIKQDENGFGKVFKIRYNGNGETSVTPKSRPNDDILSITYANNLLYFKDSSGIGTMSLDGSTKTYLLTGYAVSDYSVYGEYLYFVYQGKIFRIKSGSGSEQLACNAANVQKINISGDTIYLIADNGICSMPVNGGNVTVLNSQRPTSINVCGNYIFGNKGIFSYRMKLDGSEAVEF